jgi:heavy metal sensor kinase
LSIKLKMTLWYLFILAVTLVIFSVVTYFALSNSLYNIAQSDYRLTAVQPESPLAAIETTEATFTQPVPIMSYVIGEDWLASLKKQSSNSLLSIYTTQGQVVIDQKKYISADMEGEQQVRIFLRYSASNPGYYEVLVSSQPISEVNDTLAAFKKVLYIAIPVTALLAGLFGFLLIWRLLQPVSEISRAAHAIEETDLSRRIEVKSDDELGRLSLTLNQTFEHLQKAFEREHQFTADASHELRTPLAIMQGEATLALNKERSQEEYRKSLEIISQETAHMSSIINKLLVLSRADSGKERLNARPVDLNRLLTEIASDIEVLCDEKSLHFSLELGDKITLQADEIKLRELFLNLLDNAVHYTAPGGSISLAMTRNENSVIISVSDTGIGIAEEHLPHIFKRFYRVEKARAQNEGGAGLGLAICQGIAKLHGGIISVQSKLGTGSTFSVSLPISGKRR